MGRRPAPCLDDLLAYTVKSPPSHRSPLGPSKSSRTPTSRSRALPAHQQRPAVSAHVLRAANFRGLPRHLGDQQHPTRGDAPRPGPGGADPCRGRHTEPLRPLGPVDLPRLRSALGSRLAQRHHRRLQRPVARRQPPARERGAGLRLLPAPRRGQDRCCTASGSSSRTAPRRAPAVLDRGVPDGGPPHRHGRRARHDVGAPELITRAVRDRRSPAAPCRTWPRGRPPRAGRLGLHRDRVNPRHRWGIDHEALSSAAAPRSDRGRPRAPRLGRRAGRGARVAHPPTSPRTP